jgi:hypothetical protein
MEKPAHGTAVCSPSARPRVDWAEAGSWAGCPEPYVMPLRTRTSVQLF